MPTIEHDVSQVEPPKTKRFNSKVAMALIAVALLAVPVLLVSLALGMSLIRGSEAVSSSGDASVSVVQGPDESGNWCVTTTGTETPGSLCVIDQGGDELRVLANGLAADAEVTVTGATGNTMTSPVDTPDGDFDVMLGGLIITLPVQISTTWADGTPVTLTAQPG